MAKKKPGKKSASPGRTKPAAKRGAANATRGKSRGARKSWLDPKSNSPLIDEYAQQLGTFIEAMADGIIDEKEVSQQEARVVKLMKTVEPNLTDEQHEAVTRLLCELTAYNIMQMLHAMHAQRKPVRFRG